MEAADGNRPKPKSQVSPARNILGVALLLSFGGAAAFEFLAYGRFNAAVAAVEKRLAVANNPDASTDVPERPNRAEAEKILGRTADGPLVSDTLAQSTTYTWGGLFRKYHLTAYYTLKEPIRLVSISTEAPRG